MDAEEKVSDRDTSLLSDPPSDSDSSASDSPANQTEWLATTRKRRATAGNRMKTMLANEEPDSDLELLFAEDGNDQGFSGADDNGSDINMDSSSDDEDENNADDDDLAGEKELERLAKEKRAAQRKRKAQEAIPAKFRKKVRIDPTTPSSSATTPAPRYKKKSERASWLPSVADLPTRSSSRSTTRISKEQLHLQMKEREARRLKQQAQMEKKARLKEAKRPPMTQEERLAEAAIVEERNSKSLNRWEEAEKQREEERRAKLAALNQRTLKGPVITFWSGKGQWDDVDLRGLRPYVTVVEDKPKKKRERMDKGGKGKKGKLKEGEEDQKSTPDVVVKVEGNAEEISKRNNPAHLEGSAPKTNGQGAQAAPTSEEGEKQDDTLMSSDAKREPGPTGQQDGITEQQPEKLSSTEVAPEPMENILSEKESPDHGTEVKATDSAENDEAASTDQQIELPGSGAATDAMDVAMAGNASENSLGGKDTENADLTAAVKDDAAAPAEDQGASPANSQPAEDITEGTTPLAVEVTAPLASATQRPEDQVQATTTEAPLPDDTAGPKPPAHEAAEPSASQAPTDTGERETLQNPQAGDGESDIRTPLPNPQVQAVQDLHPDALASQSTSPRDSEAPAAPPPDANATRNAILFQNFNIHLIKDRSIQTQILFGRKMNRLPKPAPPHVCVITSNPARYRDPQTSLPFYDIHAFRELRRLNKGDYHFSKLLGAWVGAGNLAARGVPQRFTDPNYVEPNQDKQAAPGHETATTQQDASLAPTAPTTGSATV